MDLNLGLGKSTPNHILMKQELDLEKRIKVIEENRGRELVQLNLLPLVKVPLFDSTQLGFPWSPENRNLKSLSVEEAEEGRIVSTSKRDFLRGGEEKERGRKKLRLSKEQSAFLEESFKKQNTLNPKLKFYLAKQLNLRPRQIEVWFQNRRARTKLKLMEMDFEFLKRRCEMLREENRRLNEEVTNLRYVKILNFKMPPNTISKCPSCEHILPPTSTPRPSPIRR